MAFVEGNARRLVWMPSLRVWRRRGITFGRRQSATGESEGLIVLA